MESLAVLCIELFEEPKARAAKSLAGTGISLLRLRTALPSQFLAFATFPCSSEKEMLKIAKALLAVGILSLTLFDKGRCVSYQEAVDGFVRGRISNSEETRGYVNFAPNVGDAAHHITMEVVSVDTWDKMETLEVLSQLAERAAKAGLWSDFLNEQADYISTTSEEIV